MSTLDRSGVQFWNANTGSWITLDRGPKGATGAAGPQGPGFSERAKSAAHRRLGVVNHNIGQGWTQPLYVATAAMDAEEVNPPIVASASTGKFNVTADGVYLVTALQSSNTGAPNNASDRWVLMMMRYPGSWKVAQVAFGETQTVNELTALIPAKTTDTFEFWFLKTDAGAITMNAHMYVVPVGPSVFGTWP